MLSESDVTLQARGGKLRRCRGAENVDASASFELYRVKRSVLNVAERGQMWPGKDSTVRAADQNLFASEIGNKLPKFIKTT